MPLHLETDRLMLRHFQNSDLDAFVSYRSDPLVARYQGWTAPFARETGKAFLDEMKIAQPGIAGQWFQAAVELKRSGELVGDVAFHVMKNDELQAYMGVTIARSHWRKGYGVEACRRLLSFLFKDLKLHRVVAECDVENVASCSLFEKLGFRREAHLIENIWFKGGWGSEYHYAMLEREWSQK